MARSRTSRPSLIRRALDPDRHLSEVEGLAAGTGLLTGDVVRTIAVANLACPRCSTPAEALVIDLVAGAVKRRCPKCLHEWTVEEDVNLPSAG